MRLWLERKIIQYGLVSLIAQRIHVYAAEKDEKKKKLETDTTVKFSHVIIYTLALRECLETDPTCVSVTA